MSSLEMPDECGGGWSLNEFDGSYGTWHCVDCEASSPERCRYLMTKKMNFRLRLDVLIEAENEREALAIVAEHFDRVASVKDRSQVGNPFVGGKWEVQLVFTKPLREEFRKAYDKAVEDSKADFEWRGMPFVVDYAKYLLEYLETQPLKG
jgi:hypothetical protein